MTALELRHDIRISTELLGNDENALKDILNYIKSKIKSKSIAREDVFSELTGTWENDGKSVEEAMAEIRNARVSGETRKIECFD